MQGSAFEVERLLLRRHRVSAYISSLRLILTPPLVYTASPESCADEAFVFVVCRSNCEETPVSSHHAKIRQPLFFAAASRACSFC